MIRLIRLPFLALLSTPGFVFGCSTTEPAPAPLETPDLVYTQAAGPPGPFSIHGYTEGEGSYEIAPGDRGLPAPRQDLLLVRPTTGELLYISDDPAHQGHILLNPASGEFRRLDIPGEVQNWSPTGERLTTYSAGVHLAVTLEGSIGPTLCGPPLTCGVARWTADGSAVTIFRQPAGSAADLWRMPMDGGPEVNLTKTPGQHEIGPSYSPNGQYLVYERRPNFELVVSAPDGSDPRVLIAPVGLGNFPWSPDGSSVAVDASVGGQTGLVVIPVVGNPRLVSPPGEALAIVSEIDWSPDGNRLAYAAFESPTSDIRGIFVINADGTGRRQVSPPGVNAYSGTWMPAE